MKITALRRLHSLIAVVVMLVALGTACGSDENDDTEPIDSNEGTTTTTVAPDVDDRDDDTDGIDDPDDMSTETGDNGEMVDTEGTDTNTGTETETPDDSAATATTVPVEEPVSFTEEEQAVADAWLNVFSPDSTWEEMRPHLTGIEEIEDLAREYAETKTDQTFPGVTLEVVSVDIAGTTADITFDILLNGSLLQPGNSGVLTLVDETWVVQYDTFCDMVALAGYSCDLLAWNA
ncbi:MAG: hypothetical protein OXI96_02540 [Acidimicrobiaceae bacterium]|nr:hypothetical protein [Acidimicrobiaceae bacterium]